MLQTYKQDPKLQIESVKEGEELIFVTKKEVEAQKPIDIKTIKCFKRNKMGYYARECLDKKTCVVVLTADKEKNQRERRGRLWHLSAKNLRWY